MHINRMRHDGRTDDADGKQQRIAVGYLRQHEIDGCRTPVGRSDEHLDEVAERDDSDQAADDQLDRPEAKPFEHQDAVDNNPGNDHPIEERHTELLLTATAATEKL